MGMAGRCAPHFLFETSKRKCAAPGGKEKMFGGSVCASADLLPPAGEGWHSLVEVRDGNVRPLGKPPARGSTGIHPAPIFAAAGSPARERERQRKEKQRQYDNHPDEVGTIRHGSAATGIAEEHSVPEGQSKSEQAPIRRPPLRAEGHCTGARPSGLFFWTVHGPFSFPQEGKENGGCIPAGQAPCGSRIPVAAGRRPKFPRAVCNLPYTLQGRPYHRAAEGGGPYGCTERIYPRASLRPSR